MCKTHSRRAELSIHRMLVLCHIRYMSHHGGAERMGATMAKWSYKVVKSQRGLDGKWFRHPAAATFQELDEAISYAKQFAASQENAGVGGTRINVLSRRLVSGDFGPTQDIAEYRVPSR